MAEFTYFSRLEPRPRANDFTRSLAAEVRDPLWFLTRQWQMGEFTAADAGSLAFVEYAGHVSRIPRWSHDATELDLSAGAPLERQTLREPFQPDIGMQVELGQDFSDGLTRIVGDPTTASALLAAFASLPEFQLDRVDDAPFVPVDPATKRFLLVCGESSLNGVALYRLGQGIAAGSASVPAAVTTDPPVVAQVESGLAELVQRVADVFGEVGAVERTDPVTWRKERLEYRLQVVGVDPSGQGNATLDAHPDSDGEFEWFSFDVTRKNPAAAEAAPVAITDAMIPTRIEFPGMPSPRFWKFEENTLSLPDIAAQGDDLVKLLVTDFMLVHSTDWYVFPFEQEVGTLAKTDRVVVHDVFGQLTLVERADKNATAVGTNRWSMFSITDRSAATESLADYFILPPSPGAAMQLGSVLEDVRFGRDETANMAWGIERVTTSPIGEQRSGRERNAEIDALRGEPAVTPSDNEFPLRYRVQTDVPANWVPLLPRQANASNPSMVLVKAAATKDVGDAPQPVPALSTLLNPPTGGQAYVIEEEEIPRDGLQVQRVVYRARWVDGSTHLWVQRRRRAGAGESQSGLQFDQALSKKD